MGIEYYSFALFIAALICLVAILFKLLFSNVRKSRKLLDEKEAKLLGLYRSVENIIEDFNEQIKASMDDMKEYETRASAHLAAVRAQAEMNKAENNAAPKAEQQAAVREVPQPVRTPERAKAMTVDSTRIRAASEVLERAERMIKTAPEKSAAAPAAAGQAHSHDYDTVQSLFDDYPAEYEANDAKTNVKNSRRDSILNLHKDGKTHAQIARALSITQNEVKLVIDLLADNG